MRGLPDVLAIIDTETTGMRPGFARVMDIGIIRIERGVIVRKYQTFVNPGMAVPGFISSFTGISDDDLAGAPLFEEVALEVENLLKDAVFVAHNAAFDYGFIKAEFARIGIEWRAETLCSVKLSRALFPKEKSHSLDALIERHGIRCTSRHRALPDAEVVYEFLTQISARFSAEALQNITAAILGGMYGNVGRDTFSKLPESAGVYLFYGPEQELLYVGKSKHVRSRARSHFNPSAVGGASRFSHDVTSIDAVETTGELSALLLESSLIKNHSPLHNRMLRKKKILVVAKRVRDRDGYDRIVLEKTGDIDPKDSVMSVFRTVRQAKDILHSLAKDFRLCEKMLNIDSSSRECFARQLGACDGACIGMLPASDHNLRVNEAFRKRRIVSWPYSGPIVIKEESSDASGTVFFLDNWVLRGAFRYDEGVYMTLMQGSERFEYDTYKILARYLRKRSTKRMVQEVSQAQFHRLLQECSGTSGEYVVT